MIDAAGRLVTLVAYDEDGLPHPLLVDADGYLLCVNMGGAEGGALKTPNGKLMTPVANDPDDLPRPILVDADGYLKVSIAGGGGAWILIEDKLVTSTLASVEITDIPATYKQLRMEYITRCNAATEGQYLRCRINDNETASYQNYTTLHYYNDVWDDAENLNCSFAVVGRFTAGNSDAYLAAGGFVLFSNPYAGVFYKSMLGKSTCITKLLSGRSYPYSHVSIFRSVQAIESLLFYPAAGSIIAGSRFSLYGLS